MDLQLTGRTALVTGSSSGIGRAIAETLANEGAQVVVHGRDETRTKDVVDAITQAGGVAEIALGDLTSDSGAQAVVDAALAHFGGIEILVNNAGGGGSLNGFNASAKDWADVYEHNVISAIRTISILSPMMKEAAWGRIVNIASGVATQPTPQIADYSASKAAIVNLTVSLAETLAYTGVTVNTVSPGTILTKGLQRAVYAIAEENGWPTDDWDALEARIAREVWPNSIGRIGRVADIATAVAFIVSPLAGYIHGANLRVDGGNIKSIN